MEFMAHRQRNIRIVLFVIIVATLPFYCAGFYLWGTASPRSSLNGTATLAATNTPIGANITASPGLPTPTLLPLTATALSPLLPTPLQFVPPVRPPATATVFLPPIIPTSTAAPSLTPFPSATPFIPSATPIPLPTNTPLPPLPTETPIPPPTDVPPPTETPIPLPPTETPLPMDPIVEPSPGS
jgi:hypothetical protein